MIDEGFSSTVEPWRETTVAAHCDAAGCVGFANGAADDIERAAAGPPQHEWTPSTAEQSACRPKNCAAAASAGGIWWGSACGGSACPSGRRPHLCDRKG